LGPNYYYFSLFTFSIYIGSSFNGYYSKGHYSLYLIEISGWALRRSYQLEYSSYSDIWSHLFNYTLPFSPHKPLSNTGCYILSGFNLYWVLLLFKAQFLVLFSGWNFPFLKFPSTLAYLCGGSTRVQFVFSRFFSR